MTRRANPLIFFVALLAIVLGCPSISTADQTSWTPATPETLAEYQRLARLNYEYGAEHMVQPELPPPYIYPEWKNHVPPVYPPGGTEEYYRTKIQQMKETGRGY